MIYKVVLLRHGESIWNKENRFTGWTDIDLSERGIEEAQKAGEVLAREKFVFDIAYTSVLKRAIRTLWIVLDKMDLMWIPVELSWRLNERHYGALQGLNKSEMAQKYGEEQVLLWRRSYAVRPPALDPSDERCPHLDPRYSKLLDEAKPLTESLKDTVVRVVPFWEQTIASRIKKGDRVLISAHGNSLRALVKHLDNISDEAIVSLNIPTGIPLVYELDEKLRPVKNYYLGNPEEVKAAQEKVAAQGKKR